MRLFNYKFLKPSLFSVSIFSLHNTNAHDQVNIDDDGEDVSEGWKRLKKMFSYDEYGGLSPQCVMVTHGGVAGFLAGFMVGSFNYSQEALVRYKAENRLTAYTHHLEAKRRLYDSAILSFLKGGWKMGWRLSYSTSGILLIILSLNTYKGYSSISDFALAGATTFSLYRLRDGPKAQISGAVVGAGMAAVLGALCLTGMKLTGITFETIYEEEAKRLQKYYQEESNKTAEYRQKQWGRAFKIEKLETDQLVSQTTETSEMEEPKKDETSRMDEREEENMTSKMDEREEENMTSKMDEREDKTETPKKRRDSETKCSSPAENTKNTVKAPV